MTRIEWTDETWNPVTGCDPISSACDHCYARRMAQRLRGRYGYDKDDPFRITYHHDKFALPYLWRKPRRIFVCSMGDLFHIKITDHYINQVVQAVWDNPHHTFQILTKRAGRMADYFNRYFKLPHNLWLGASVEDQHSASLRLPLLLSITKAAVLFASAEPLLGPIALPEGPLGWLIAGGETGPGARELDPSWMRNLRDECVSRDIPFFFKGWGDRFALLHHDMDCYKRMIDSCEWNQYPTEKGQL